VVGVFEKDEEGVFVSLYVFFDGWHIRGIANGQIVDKPRAASDGP